MAVATSASTTIYDEERKYLVYLGLSLIVEYILFLIILRGLSHCDVIFRNLSEGKLKGNSINIFCYTGGALLLTYLRVLIFLCLLYLLLKAHFLNSSDEWNQYTSWSLYFGCFYFLLASVFSARKIYYTPTTPVEENLLIDPTLTVITNCMFNLLVPLAFVASAYSGFVNRFFLYEDHVVTIGCFIDMLLNTFAVGFGDLFLCISFSYIYIAFVWMSSAFLEVRWPHNIFKMKTVWCFVTYNAFIFAHIAAFTLYYSINNRCSCIPRRKRKVNPTKDNIEDGNDDAVVPFENLSDIESSIEPDPEPEPEKISPPPPVTNTDAQDAALLAQMIAERTEKKRVLEETEKLRVEVEELKSQNARDHAKLKKVVGKLSERDYQMKQLEIWLAAKNDEELAKIKMQMADKLNVISEIKRPKSAGGGDVISNTSTLQDMDAKEPVLVKNFQALSTLRKMKERKYAPDDNDNTKDEADKIYQTL